MWKNAIRTQMFNANICIFSVVCYYFTEYVAIFMVRYGT